MQFDFPQLEGLPTAQVDIGLQHCHSYEQGGGQLHTIHRRHQPKVHQNVGNYQLYTLQRQMTNLTARLYNIH